MIQETSNYIICSWDDYENIENIIIHLIVV